MNKNPEKKSLGITEEVVEHVAKLSRLSFDAVTIKQFQSQVSKILDYIDQLKEVDTANTPPTTHVLSAMKNVFREDINKESISSSEALSNAPDKEDNKFFKVPKIIES
ncbi:Glu-tRNAGln amidotransferase, C subunit [Candidatus Omnitrophus magneticus]|uniref:Aspartyl/glutamyl-tRNA(Asn/Gln) amidotransferase subunit C n=1 Tax=Candidatus Omnitrophus magneticus TaxID=1609969 RepID=A0A0F0CQZ1_9BACT|nr:Glu-tRNAGln amidotransferase, C subunit [Candidatus Omnitrophus magneticus]